MSPGIPPIACGIGENVEQVAWFYLDADEKNPVPFDRDGFDLAMGHLLNHADAKAVALVAVRAKVTATGSVIEALRLRGSVFGSMEPGTMSVATTIRGVRFCPARINVEAQVMGLNEAEVVVQVEQDLFRVQDYDLGYNRTAWDLYWFELRMALPGWVARHLHLPEPSRGAGPTPGG